MTENWSVNIFLNPFMFIEAEKDLEQIEEDLSFPEAMLKYFCKPDVDYDRESIIYRYHEIMEESKQLHIAPNEERILVKLVWPLKNAICCYMFGNYLGTIALCGMVAEMASILKFEISNITIDGRVVDSSIQKEIFGCEYEKLGQERRVKVLAAFNLVSDEMKKQFDIIRTARRRYLHFLSYEHSTISSDALAVFRASISIVIDLIGQDIFEGKFVFKPDMMRYLERKGLARPHNTNE